MVVVDRGVVVPLGHRPLSTRYVLLVRAVVAHARLRDLL
jgi:hypothetical protein